MIAGGDTVLIRGSIGTGVSYRVGMNKHCKVRRVRVLREMPEIRGCRHRHQVPPPSTRRHILGENSAFMSFASLPLRRSCTEDARGHLPF